MKDAPTAVVRFRGGPLGGETREFSRHDIQPRMRVPALINFTSYTSEVQAAAALPPSVIDGEEYEVRPSGVGNYEARWIHPQERLLAENERLKDRLRELRRAEEVLDALRTIKELL